MKKNPYYSIEQLSLVATTPAPTEREYVVEQTYSFAKEINRERLMEGDTGYRH